MAERGDHDAGKPEDEKALDAFFAEVAPKLGDLVTVLLQQGKPFALLAAFFSRGFDGTITGGCGARAGVAKRVLSDARFAEPTRTHVLEALRVCPLDALPVLLVVERGEGLVVVGVRRERGELVTTS